MSSLFDELKTGLQEAIDFEKGSGSAKTTVYVVKPVQKYTNQDIKRIRNEAGMTQAVFASYMGVSVKTVEAWETGTNSPIGPARRLLAIMKSDPDFVSKYHLISK